MKFDIRNKGIVEYYKVPPKPIYGISSKSGYLALPNIWRASCATLIMISVLGVVFGIFIFLKIGVLEGMLTGIIMVLIPIVVKIFCAWRLQKALSIFASSLPPNRIAYDSWLMEDQGIRWPELGVEVRGRIWSRFFLTWLVVELNGSILFSVPSRKAREAGEDVARRLGLKN